MRAIFISYRRDDTEGQAGRLFEDLCARFGAESVFMDVAGIEPGRDFRRVIEQQVSSCGVLLALIGQNWLGAIGRDGKPRLDDPYDFVRLETASALKRDIPVVPVLVRDAAMPRADQLPDDLKELAFRNSVELTHARWASDVQVLINALRPYVDATPPAPAPAPMPSPAPVPAPPATPAFGRSAWVATPLALLALGGAAYVGWDRLGPARPGEGAGGGSAPIAVSDPASAVSPSARVAAAAASVGSPPPGPTSAQTPAAAPLAAHAASTTDKPIPAVKPAPAPAPKPAVVASPKPLPASAVATAPGPAAAPPPAAGPAPSPATGPRPTASPVAAGAELLATRDPGTDLYGSAATPAMVTRTIQIRPDTSFVNVTGGEVIRFEVGTKTFVWSFNGPRSSFDLALIAPPGLLARKITAYVAPDPARPRRG